MADQDSQQSDALFPPNYKQLDMQRQKDREADEAYWQRLSPEERAREFDAWGNVTHQGTSDGNLQPIK